MENPEWRSKNGARIQAVGQIPAQLPFPAGQALVRQLVGQFPTAIRRFFGSLKDLISLPGFSPIETEHGKIGLSFYNFTVKNDTLKECKIGINLVKDGYSHRQDLGALTYSAYKRRPNF